MFSHAYESYTVEKITGLKLIVHDGILKLCCYVKWAGYDEYTWEPISELEENIGLEDFYEKIKIMKINQFVFTSGLVIE